MADNLRTVADRRHRDAQAPRLDVRGPLSKSIGRDGSAGRTPEPKGSGLTRRERKVKAILLQELNKINGEAKTWAAYQERQHLTGALDVAFIDREIDKMEHELRQRPVLWWTLGAAYLALGAGSLYQAATGGVTVSTFLNLLLVVSGIAGIGGSVYYNRKATQRRLWIYQALRELSDAEEEDVQLDESVRLADLLIDRIVEQEARAAPTPLYRIRTH